MDTKLLNRIKLVTVFSIFLITGIILFIIFKPSRVEEGAELYQSEVFGTNYSYSKLQNPGTIRFFTGTAIAESRISDPSTSKSLTSEFGLGVTQKVIWTKTGALVKSGPLDKLSPLFYTSLSNSPQKEFYEQNATWWIIDVKDNSILPVSIAGENKVFVGDVCVAEDKIYATTKPTRASVDSVISQYTLGFRSDLVLISSLKDSYSTPDIISCANNRLVYRDGKGVLYISNSDLSNTKEIASNVVFTAEAGQDKIVFSEQETAKESADGDQDHSKASRQSIKMYSFSSEKIENVVNIENQKFFVVDNELILQFTDDTYKYVIYDLGENESLTSHVINVNKQSIEDTASIIKVADGGNSFILISSSGDLSLIEADSNIANITSSNPPFKFKENPTETSSGQLIYDFAQNSAEVYFSSGESTIDQSIVSTLKELSSETKDINQIKKKWLYVGEFYE